MLIAESESDLQNLVSAFDSVCKRRILKVNVNKSKVMVCEWSRSPYRVGIECEKECKIILNGEEMEEIYEFKYLGSVICKCGGTEGETRGRTLQGRKVVGSLGRVMNGKSVSMEVKRDLSNTVIVPTLTYASETWTWNESQRSRVQAVEMSCLRHACGVSRMDGMSNESVCEHFGMCYVGIGKERGVVEEVKQQTLKWFDHVEQMEEGKMTKRVYVSEIEGGNVRGRPPVKWRDRMQEYVRGRGEGS